MTTLGEKWKKGLVETAAKKEMEEAAAVIAKERADVEACISRIPAKIDDAIDRGCDSIELESGYLNEEDISASFKVLGRRSRVYTLAKKKKVSAEHFKSHERQLVIKWCEENGLECFLRAIVWNDPNDSDSYELAARPKL